MDNRSRNRLCAYAITREHTLEPAGPVDVRLVPHRGLALVVAEVDPAPFAELTTAPGRWRRTPKEDDPLVLLARRHDVVVRAVFEHHPVLPLRFGTVLPDEAAAVRLLANHHAEARAWLDRVDGHREWVVRARFNPPDRSAELSAEGLSDPEYQAVRRDRLASAAHARRDAVAAAGALHGALARHAADDVRRERRSAAPLLDAAYLVSLDAEQGFHAEAERHEGLAVEVTGPWPPYSFVPLDLPAEAVAHA